MTNEEAILILKQYMPKPGRGNGKFMQTLTITEAFLLAIKALDEQMNTQRPKGKWIPRNDKCPCCGENKFKDLDADIYADWYPKFCPNCGAEMEVSE